MSTSPSGERVHTGAPVLIVGAGPVGLSLAGDLGWRGIPSILFEQSDGSILQPKMDGVNVRTMEFCRRWGIRDEVRNCDYPSDYPQDMVFMTGFGGYEIGRESFMTPSGGAEERGRGPSPEVRVRCPQNLFDPILRRFAESSPWTSVRYRHRVVDFTQAADRVDVTIENVESGTTNVVSGAYLIGCDGGSSLVREKLGIKMEGRGPLTFTTNVIFKCKNLQGLHDKLLAYRHLLVGPEGTWGTVVAINGRDQWRLSIIGGSERRLMSDEEIHRAIRRCLALDVPYEIVSVLPWARRELVAEQYSSGRVFLAGDSAHVMSPTGGFGMNVGIGDAVDLSWKLAAVVRGWGGRNLLRSYGVERRPVGLRAVREASGNLLRTQSPGPNPNLLDATIEGALARYNVGRRLSATLLREWYKLGIDLGYIYADSPICARDNAGCEAEAGAGGGASPSALRELHKLAIHKSEGYEVNPGWLELSPEEVMLYVPTARPGARAPHVWLKDGRSTLDLFGPGFTLLQLASDAPPAAPLQERAAGQAIPLNVLELDEPDVLKAYGAPLVLIRPDGHVAWRGQDWSQQNIAALLDRVRGEL
jgi:2-polyprenyl-6-methoxyphenol hydroxylase-like FAD-dependent oxidoreductase